jgi:hypothetical protein
MSELLRTLAAQRYAPRAIPGPRDSEIAELISTVVTRKDYDDLASGLDLRGCRILNLFAKRAASLAVRLGDDSWVRRGLIAAMLSSTVEDYREIARTNSLLYRAAELAGSDPVALFESAAQLADSVTAETTRLFSHADESARSISVMGYTEGADEDGFRFISLW